MRKTLKIATVAAILFLALGAIVFVYASSHNSLTANDDEQQTALQNFFLANGTMPPGHMKCRRPMQGNGFGFSQSFLENATLNTVQGTIVSQYKGVLILNTGSGQIRVLVPKDWTLDNEVVGRADLFNGTFASAGQSVTIKVLESDVFSNASFSINVMLGYEAINSTNTTAYAVLPFNIQPSS